MVLLPCGNCTLCGISVLFRTLFPSERQVTHALLTRPPLGFGKQAFLAPFDLHVLGTPPAFVLSQDQTLQNLVSNQLSLFKSYFRVFSAQTFANVFFFLILLELRVPKIRHTFLYFTLLVCLVLFNFQGPIQPPLSRQLYYFTTLLLLCQVVVLSFFKTF